MEFHSILCTYATSLQSSAPVTLYQFHSYFLPDVCNHELVTTLITLSL